MLVEHCPHERETKIDATDNTKLALATLLAILYELIEFFQSE